MNKHKVEEVLVKAYGSIPKEVSLNLNFDVLPLRPMRYYWLKLFRKIIGR